jgi:hypothetical protein
MAMMAIQTPDDASRIPRHLEVRSQLILELWKLYVRRAIAERMAAPESARRLAYAELARRKLI